MPSPPGRSSEGSAADPRPGFHVDVAIVGAGPAGLAAAMQASRRGLSLALFEMDRPGGQAIAAHRIDDYPGHPDGISGQSLMRRFLRQALAHGVAIRQGEVLSLARSPGGFLLATTEGGIEAHTAIVACGLAPRRTGVPGEGQLFGRRIFAYADPARIPHRGRRVLILGSGDGAFDQALAFRAGALEVAIAMKHSAPSCAPHLADRTRELAIALLPSHVATRFEERGDEIVISFDAGKGRATRSADIVVECIGKEPRLSFLSEELRQGPIPGLFFAGDCRRGSCRHVAVAAGDGMASASEAAAFLQRNCSAQIPA